MAQRDAASRLIKLSGPAMKIKRQTAGRRRCHDDGSLPKGEKPNAGKPVGTPLVSRRNASRASDDERLRLAVRRRLKTVLRRVLPGKTVWIFGSLTRPGSFHPCSDIDVAIQEEPSEMSLYRLHAVLEDGLGRPADVVVLSQSRLKNKIVKEGELWTL